VQLLQVFQVNFTVYPLTIRPKKKEKEYILPIPVADDNFVIIPIFNPSTYSTSLRCPLSLNRFILLCQRKTKNVVITNISEEFQVVELIKV
jgi:hypothetical protein